MKMIQKRIGSARESDQNATESEWNGVVLRHFRGEKTFSEKSRKSVEKTAGLCYNIPCIF
jgi:hypothetical protein